MSSNERLRELGIEQYNTNNHLIGAISTTGIIYMERRRSSFTSELANDWVMFLTQRWQDMGNQLEGLVNVADNALYHSKLERVIDGTPASLLRLNPYSPMQNPIRNTTYLFTNIFSYSVHSLFVIIKYKWLVNKSCLLSFWITTGTFWFTINTFWITISLPQLQLTLSQLKL